MNDTFFYISSWGDSSIGSYKYENSTWKFTPVVSLATGGGDGSHIAVDECGRVWFVNVAFGLRIYDPSGVKIAEWDMGLSSSNWIYDILLLPNYVLLVTYFHGQKIVKYDPLVTCD